jgi:hypothetical protein
MVLGAPGEWSMGNNVTTVGALVLVAGFVALIYGIVTSRSHVRA